MRYVHPLIDGALAPAPDSGMTDSMQRGTATRCSLLVARCSLNGVAPAGADSTDGIVRIPALTGGLLEWRRSAPFRGCGADQFRAFSKLRVGSLEVEERRAGPVERKRTCRAWRRVQRAERA